MDLHLGGGLAWYDEHKRSNMTLKLAAPISFMTLLNILSIPPAEIAIISINGQFFDGDDCLLQDADTVQLYPAMGGG